MSVVEYRSGYSGSQGPVRRDQRPGDVTRHPLPRRGYHHDHRFTPRNHRRRQGKTSPPQNSKYTNYLSNSCQDPVVFCANMGIDKMRQTIGLSFKFPRRLPKI